MTTQLYWHGQTDVEVFHDSQRNIEYWPSERPHDVPDDAVEWYLSFAGWSESPPSTDDGDADGDDDAAASAEEFEALSFIDDAWQSVTAAILDGEVDSHLDAVERAEQARDPGPRDSVMGALAERREQLPSA